MVTTAAYSHHPPQQLHLHSAWPPYPCCLTDWVQNLLQMILWNCLLEDALCAKLMLSFRTMSRLRHLSKSYLSLYKPKTHIII